MISIKSCMLPYLKDLAYIKRFDCVEDYVDMFDFSHLSKPARKLACSFASRTYRLAKYNKLLIDSNTYYALANEFNELIYAVNKFSKQYFVLSFLDIVVSDYMAGDYNVQD